MIKILKNTMIDPIECTCPICSSVFTYNYEDLHREERTSLFGTPMGYDLYVICPVCKSNIDRNPKFIFNDEGAAVACSKEDKKK